MPEKDEKVAGEVVQLVNLRLRGEEFGVDISSVREITRVGDITHIPEAPSFIQGVINLRGQIIPVVDLGKQFGFAPQEKVPESARIVVTWLKGQAVGILVDEVPEVLRIPAEDIEPTPELIQTKIRRDYVKGVGKLENRLIVFLDLDKVLGPHEVEELNQISSSGEKAQVKT